MATPPAMLYWKIILKHTKDHPDRKAVRVRYFKEETREDAAKTMRGIMSHEGLKQFWTDWDIVSIKQISQAEYIRNTR